MALRRPPTTFSDEITAGDLAANSVTASELADDAVDTAALADGAVDADRLATNAVTTVKVADDAVTYAKLQNLATANRVLGATGAGVIGEVQVATAMVADDAVTGAKIEDNPTIAGNLTVAGTTTATGNVTVTGDLIPSNTPSRNLLINGAMRIRQRGDASSVGATTNIYSLDRWAYLFGYGTPAQRFTLSQQTVSGSELVFRDGFKSVFYAQCTTAESNLGSNVNRYSGIFQKIEYENLHHLRWGTADAKGLTVSFWFKSTQGGSHGCCLFMNNGASVLPRTFSVSANTWTKITLAIAANTSLQFTTDFGLSFGFLLNVGTTADNGTENTWGSFPAANSGIANIGGGSGRIIQFTGVQLEVGSATPYEHRTYGDEQKKCERYCQKYKTYTSTGFWNGGTNARTYFTLRTKMRATPSFAEQNGSGNKGTITWSGAYKTSTGSASIAAYDNDTVYFSRSGFSGGSDMVGLIHLHQNWENIFSAEL